MRVAVVTQDVIGERLAGPAIRALALGRALSSAGHEVQVRSVHAASHPSPLVVPGGLRGAEAGHLGRWAEVLVVQGDVLGPLPALARSDAAMVCDLYDPVEMEGLVRGVDLPTRARYAATRRALAVVSAQLVRGDLFLCASERQRLFWLGHLDAAGRVNPATYDRDPTLGDLLAVVPFGIEDEPPRADGPGLRGRVEGVGEGARVVLWGGGVYDWLDPLPVIGAVARLRDDVPELRLVFMGTTHPNPAVPPSSMLARARQLVVDLGVEESVRFHNGWVPYEDRHNLLLDAEIGVSGHLPHVETTLAFRTRILDYLWAGLPIVTTDGDALGELVRAEGLGEAVPPGDPDAVADALRGLLLDPVRASDAQAAVRRVAPTLRWSVVLEPVLAFCADPRPAADRDDSFALRLRAERSPSGSERWAAVREAAGSVRTALEDGGFRGLASKAVSRLPSRRAS